jgi:hypothetical protein
LFVPQIPRAELIADLRRRIGDQRESIDRLVAELRGMEAQLVALQSGVPSLTPLVDLARTDAIVEVLRQADRHLRPVEILNALNQSGRNDELRSVTATLDHLVKGERVRRADRKYSAS